MPMMLLAAGAVTLIPGVIIWLAGSAFRRVALLVIGSLVGFVFALTVVEAPPAGALLLGLLAGASGALFDKPAIGILTAVVVLSIVFCFLARPFVEGPRPEGSVTRGDNETDWRQNRVLVESHAAGLDTAVRGIFWKMPQYYRIILAAAAAVGGIIGMTFRRTAMAFCFGSLGAMFMFAGAIFLLLQRSIPAISRILGNPPFYAAVFGGTALFGMCIQLIFCWKRKAVSGDEEESGEDGSSPAGKSWRTS